MSRLHQTVLKGETKLKVAPGLDWVKGEEINLLPTATQPLHSDYATITSYDKQTGDLVISSGLKYYHFGQAQSTLDKYGVEMRGEVVLLDRNVRVMGEDTDSWGGQILVSDSKDDDGKLHSG